MRLDPIECVARGGAARRLWFFCLVITAKFSHAIFSFGCELWGAPTAFAGRGEAIEQARNLLSAIPALGLQPIGRDALQSKIWRAWLIRKSSLSWSETKRISSRVAKAAKSCAYPPRVLLLQTEAAPARSFIGPGTHQPRCWPRYQCAAQPADEAFRSTCYRHSGDARRAAGDRCRGASHQAVQPGTRLLQAGARRL